ncbi:cytochrome C oxidase subunit IV family protein [Mycobacterium sp. 050134]|uniref:cytochrome C oxidase subunit IV family protein n=1 Tax=Mycobacterium sp. 050134 TaxID=3096111 RepID=UPI002ED850A0
MLASLLRDKITVVWLGLIVATLSSWLLGVGHELPTAPAAAVIILIAFLKVHFVGRYFMEIRHAPAALATIFSVWTVVVALTLIGLYLSA